MSRTTFVVVLLLLFCQASSFKRYHSIAISRSSWTLTPRIVTSAANDSAGIDDASNDSMMSGFSRQATDETKVEATGPQALRDLVEYPCEFVIKVIGLREVQFEVLMPCGTALLTINPLSQNEFARDMVAIISRVTGVEPSSIFFSTRPGSGNKYISVSIHAPVASADILYECYAELSRDPRVKYKL